MNGLSLFSGIGGMDLGLERAGITTVGQVELDPWCRRVLAKHWPDVPRHDDVRTAADWWLGQERPHVDLVFGGFPCQDISSAGRKAGISGTRSGLWSSYADTIRRLRPRWVLLENSADIVVRGLGVVLADVAALGYDAEWDCIPAAAVGAPHRRDRWFALAYPAGAGRGRHQPDGPIAGDSGPAVGAGKTQPGRRGGTGRSFQRPVDSGWPAEPRVGRLVNGVPARLVQPRLRGLGNAVVPQVAEHVGRLIVAAHERDAA